MKRKMKPGLLAALLLGAAGLVLCFAGIAFGALKHREAFYIRVNLSDGPAGFISSLFHNVSDEDLIDIKESYTDIQALDFDLSEGEVVIKEGETFSIDAADVLPDFQTYTENGTWYIRSSESEGGFGISLFGLVSDELQSQITITIPKGAELEDTKISMDMGEITLHTLNSQSTDLDVGMGDIDVREINSSELSMSCDMGKLIAGGLRADTLTAEVSMGSIELSGDVTGSASFDVDMGGIDFTGSIKGDISADTGMGSIEMMLDEPYEYYQYDLDRDIGSITVAGETHGSEASFMGSSDAKHMMELDCDMGSITVDFR